MAWFRVDNRLVHGQVIESWLPYLDVVRLVVVNEALARDALKQEIMMLAIPSRINVSFVGISEAKSLFDNLESLSARALFLFANCQDVLGLMALGVPVTVLNVGNLHFAEGKRHICPHIAVSDQDLACFTSLKEQGVSLDFRCVPGECPVMEGWYNG